MNSAQWNVKRSLRLEMLSVHTYCGQLKEGDLVAQILNAIRLVQGSTCVPVFGEPLTLTDLRDYVAVDASLSFLNNDDDQDWSRDVLNESSASPMGGELRNRKGQEHKTPRKTGEQIGGQSGKFMQEQKVRSDPNLTDQVATPSPIRTTNAVKCCSLCVANGQRKTVNCS